MPPSFRSTQYLDPDYDNIDCETITAITTTTQNLTVTNSISLPTDSSGNNNDLFDSSENITCYNLDCSGNCTIAQNLIAYKDVRMGSGAASTINLNPYLYMSYNCGGVAPQSDSDQYPQLYACITGHYQVGSAEVDFWNLSSQYDQPTLPAFSFYKVDTPSSPLITIANNGALTVNQGITTNNCSVIATNSQFGSNLSYLGYYISSQLPSTVSPPANSNFSYTKIFTFSNLPIGVYMCMGQLGLYAPSGSEILGCIVQAIQNNNSSLLPFVWNSNFTNAVVLESNLNIILPINFMFYNNENNGNVALQIYANYYGTFNVTAPSTSYLQNVRIA
jgi:hypothetical protein